MIVACIPALDEAKTIAKVAVRTKKCVDKVSGFLMVGGP